MPKKFDSYIFSDLDINKMEKLLEFSIESKIEFGGTLCSKFNDITILKLRNLCSGNGYCLEVSTKCRNGETTIGSYHTHPPPRTDTLSLPDIESHINSGYSVDCVGAYNGTKTISCYIRKRMENFEINVLTEIHKIREYLDIIRKKGETEENIRIARSILASNLTEKYFDRFKIR